MPIKGDEYYEKIYQSLVNILHHEQLYWVVREVNEQIVMGKVTIPAPEEKRKAPRGKAPGTYSTAYTAKERVWLLIDAVRYIVVGNAYLEREISTFYLEPDAGSQAQNTPLSITFSSEVEPEDIVVVDKRQVSFRYTRVQKLVTLLDKLQELLDNGH